jgi:hypothetical protein
MTKESVIHVKLDNTEAVMAKRDILISQMNLLRIAKIIKGYSFYRIKELELKIRLYKKMKELKTNITKLQKILPTLRIPEILKKEKPEEKKEKYKKEKTQKTYDRSIEEQLQEIQRRLSNLQSREA